MTFLKVIFNVLNIFLLIHTLYFGVFAFWGLLKKARVFAETEEKRRFAVLIPARNEEAVIANLVDSIKEADYPESLIDVYAVINNCTDKTEETAREHGAKILECTAATKTKADLQFDRSYNAFAWLAAAGLEGLFALVIYSGTFRKIKNLNLKDITQ